MRIKKHSLRRLARFEQVESRYLLTVVSLDLSNLVTAENLELSRTVAEYSVAASTPVEQVSIAPSSAISAARLAYANYSSVDSTPKSIPAITSARSAILSAEPHGTSAYATETQSVNTIVALPTISRAIAVAKTHTTWQTTEKTRDDEHSSEYTTKLGVTVYNAILSLPDFDLATYNSLLLARTENGGEPTPEQLEFDLIDIDQIHADDANPPAMQTWNLDAGNAAFTASNADTYQAPVVSVADMQFDAIEQQYLPLVVADFEIVPAIEALPIQPGPLIVRDRSDIGQESPASTEAILPTQQTPSQTFVKQTPLATLPPSVAIPQSPVVDNLIPETPAINEPLFVTPTLPVEPALRTNRNDLTEPPLSPPTSISEPTIIAEPLITPVLPAVTTTPQVTTPPSTLPPATPTFLSEALVLPYIELSIGTTPNPVSNTDTSEPFDIWEPTTSLFFNSTDETIVDTPASSSVNTIDLGFRESFSSIVASPTEELLSIAPSPVESLSQPPAQTLEDFTNQLATSTSVFESTIDLSPTMELIVQPPSASSPDSPDESSTSDPAVFSVSIATPTLVSSAMDDLSQFLDAAKETTKSLMPDSDDFSNSILDDADVTSTDDRLFEEREELTDSNTSIRIPLDSDDDYIDIGAVTNANQIAAYTRSGSALIAAQLNRSTNDDQTSSETNASPNRVVSPAYESGSYGSIRSFELNELSQSVGDTIETSVVPVTEPNREETISTDTDITWSDASPTADEQELSESGLATFSNGEMLTSTMEDSDDSEEAQQAAQNSSASLSWSRGVILAFAGAAIYCSRDQKPKSDERSATTIQLRRSE